MSGLGTKTPCLKHISMGKMLSNFKNELVNQTSFQYIKRKLLVIASVILLFECLIL